MKLKNIEKLVKVLENSIVAEIEVTDMWGRKVRVSKSTNNTPTLATAQTPTTQARAESSTRHTEKVTETRPPNTVAIRSPIVGTFYRASSPDAKSYVEVGDVVKPGQVVCIVEAMKLMNEIESDVAGKIAKILAENEDPVEYNQELILVEKM
jgi:acetyl-CoA carboxylase biotin carboxyl carrier protein